MKQAFIERAFRAPALAIIAQANTIIEDMQAQGFKLSLRQLYYQFVSRDWLPNKASEYDRLGSIISDARLAGLIDWEAIEDRGRNRRGIPWDSAAELVTATADQYAHDHWLEQEWAPEVWIEKDALLGVVEPVCRRNRVPYFACRGYNSQSEAYDAGMRFRRIARKGRKPIVFHLGDHDPSGLDMTRDNRDRLAMFAGRPIEVRRLALNWNQIGEYSPPPNPAKDTDIRFAGYADQYGTESWELDALAPSVIDGLIQAALEEIRDEGLWAESCETEDRDRLTLAGIAEDWSATVDFVANREE